MSFTVSNFCSIRNAQTLSMLRPGQGTTSRLALGEDPAGGDISPLAVIFGANASGKSTLIAAMSYTMWLVTSSATREATKPLPMHPFLLDDQFKFEPFSVETRFTCGEREFIYAFTVTNGEINTENLREVIRRPTRSSTQTLFNRTMQGETIQVTTAPTLKGHKRTIIAATRPNSLFLSKAAQENYLPLMDVYRWFADFTFGVGRGSLATTPTQSSLDRFESDPEFAAWVADLLLQADLGVTDIRLSTASRPPKHLVSALTAAMETEDPNEIARIEEELARSSRHPILNHRSVTAGTLGHPLPWNTESKGTHLLWDLSSDLYQALKTGRTFIMDDELSDMHPLIVKSIIQAFQSSTSNPHGAQLIFTSHDVTLLGTWAGQGYQLERDQIWFTEKDYASGATSIIPLTNFRTRKDEDTERLYLQGRLGGMPVVGYLPPVD
ncbi:MAG: ATP-binding protein [Propionibacteriaceae bacterium]|nr:ATP-binding protein [Propionibacteriaceae bacterium]